MSAWPSIDCTARMSAPFMSRSVAKECLKVWGDTCLVMPARRAYFSTILSTDRAVILR